TEIDDRFVRHVLEHGAGDGEAADAGVEDAERCRVHRDRGRLTPTPSPPPRPPAPSGNARIFRSLGKSRRCAETNASAPGKKCLKIHKTSQSCTSCRFAPSGGQLVSLRL